MPESDYKYAFTVFTPTYNRAYCLGDLYESLREQTFKDFEWLIVDDGSTDNTEEVVNGWIQEGSLRIRFIKQENGGKHRATNRAVSEAQGALFLIVDSDDTLLPGALTAFSQEWRGIPDEQRKNYQGVTCVNVDQHGKIIGGGLPTPRIDCRSYELRYKMGYSGDMSGFVATDVLKQFPFPEFPGEKFISEGVVWLRIDRRYLTRFANHPVKCVNYLQDGLTAGNVANRMRNPHGARAVQREIAKSPIPIKIRLKATANYVRFSFHAGIPFARSAWESGVPWLIAFAAPVGYAAYLRDKKKLSQPS